MIVSAELGIVLWTTRQAARAAGVSENVVRVWVHRGHLHQAAGSDGKPLSDSKGCPLYWAKHVAEAEAATRDAARRNSEQGTSDAPDLDLHRTLWTTAEAAEAAGVDPGVIRIWAHRGHLKRANSEKARFPKYRAIDVIRAERSTRERARRVYPLAA